ncbi:thiolase family protein [Rhodococcus pseudokoreensis]|uniref:Thiolase family protein n=1 Tax=Rhodococcus pseudokoreensis TaxID=2811421 RepID=A0A974WHB3_9NOCA|nr:thiolase family protein [Rhodococcus pseudokoreensis]
MTIIGAAALPVGKWQTPPDAAVQVLEHEVLARLVLQAAAEAGIEKGDIQGMTFAQPRPYTAQKYFATFMAHYLRLPCAGNISEVLGNGMTGGFAFEHAANDILLGRSKVSLALGVNFETAVTAREHMMSSMRAVGDVDFQAPFGITPIAWYAMDATRYIHDHGSSREELATVAVKNRRHAELNPLAQFRTPITLDDVLAQPMIVEPLGLFEVPPRSDGAVCLVLAEEEVARSLGKPYVRVRGRGFYHEGAHQISEVPNDMTALAAARTAGRQAYEDAKIAPTDIDLAEIYAPCTIVEVLAGEALGLTPTGRGARYAAEGRTSLGGDIPICTSGGLTSRGHPAYITPLYSFVEAFEQLRGTASERQVSGAELALTSAELGNYNAALVHILEGVH